MNDEIRSLEQDIEVSRARLDNTIDRLQDRLSVSGIVDDMLGTARANPRLRAAYDETLAVIRRNPLPVILIAAGVGLLLTRLGQSAAPRARRAQRLSADEPEYDEGVPVIQTVPARIYDPDLSPRHPTQDILESRRELSARA